MTQVLSLLWQSVDRNRYTFDQLLLEDTHFVTVKKSSSDLIEKLRAENIALKQQLESQRKSVSDSLSVTALMGQLERENEELKIENSKLKEEMSTNHRAKMAKLENQLALMGDTKSTKVKSFHVKCCK